MALDINLNLNAENSELTVLLAGRLDTLTSPELDEKLTENIPGIKNLIFDMTELKYISSSGLRVLLKYQAEMKKTGGMKIKNVRKEVMAVLEITGFTKFLNIE